MNSIDIHKSIWIRLRRESKLPLLRRLQETLLKHGVEILYYDDRSSIESILNAINRSDKHVILDSPAYLPTRLYRGLQHRGNFSLGLYDWWAFPEWIMEGAEFVFFRHFTGITARRRGTPIPIHGPTPLWEFPENYALLNLTYTALRIPALALLPFLIFRTRHLRRKPTIDQNRLFYFPFAVPGNPPAALSTPPKFDFANVGSTSFYALMRSGYVPARLNCINLYSDRLAMIRAMLKSEGDSFRIFDCRRTPVWGADTLAVILDSRYAITTSGLHDASIGKFLEIASLGTPSIGRKPRGEFPILDDCIFEVDPFRCSRLELHRKFVEALDSYRTIKENTMAKRDQIIKLYDQDRLLQLLQVQVDGHPLPVDYIKPD